MSHSARQQTHQKDKQRFGTSEPRLDAEEEQKKQSLQKVTDLDPAKASVRELENMAHSVSCTCIAQPQALLHCMSTVNTSAAAAVCTVCAAAETSLSAALGQVKA